MRIETDDLIVRRCLETQALAIRAHGGFIHPELAVRHRGDSLSIICRASAEPTPLLDIPHGLFVPITDLHWRNDGGVLQYSGDTNSLSAVQHTLLDTMVTLFNQTEKIERYGLQLPALLLAEDSGLSDWVGKAGAGYQPSKESPAQHFIQTRTSWLEINQGSGKFTLNLMPLIDCLNHHPNGSKLIRTPEAQWRIMLQNPIPGSSECFLRYNKCDSLSLALWHGYAETHTDHLAVLDCHLEHSGFGPVHMVGNNLGNWASKAPRIILDEPILTLCDLVLRAPELPSLRVFLALAVRSKQRELAQRDAEVIADELIALLIDANIQKYSELLALCQTETENFPLRPLFGQVAEHQLELLDDLRAIQGQRK
jgi:hypothetical protein